MPLSLSLLLLKNNKKNSQKDVRWYADNHLLADTIRSLAALCAMDKTTVGRLSNK